MGRSPQRGMGLRFLRHDRRVPDLIAQSVERLRTSGVRLDRGLSDEEVSHVQSRLEFSFGPEHRDFIQSALPVGERWPDWRNDADEDHRGRLDWPVGGVLFDVHNNGFWPASWGNRPDRKDDREHEARAHLAGVPKRGRCGGPPARDCPPHRYLASDARYKPSPAFSVYQADVIIYGNDLLDYVAHEFHVPPLHPADRTHVPFWSDIAEGAENRDM